MAGDEMLGAKMVCSALLVIFLLTTPVSCAKSSRDNHSAQSGVAQLEISSAATRRFIAAHGRRALVMGYPETGLEVWAYPLQILSGYQVWFRPADSATELDGRLLLRRVIEKPDSVTRIYIGPDFIVREKLFVPLDEPAAILSYEVQAQHPVLVNIHFTPVLNLMWPGALGGQNVSWDSTLPGYVLEEPAHALRALIASPEIVLHDSTANSTLRSESQLTITIQPDARQGSQADMPASANIYIDLLSSPNESAVNAIRALESRATALEAAAGEHYSQLEQNALQITTPDDDANSALAWSEVALDQAWVCNPALGCGIVAGYGPSRGARRPQYAWFFAGDGLVAVNALVSAGEYERARDELLFIAKYQDKKTGMIWHELSQSTGYLDWSKYPYMYVHVDISFDYVNTIARYVLVSGDTGFAADQWTSINAAYLYCSSLIGADGLPHIPSGKEGSDEQHRRAEDLGLSTAWVAVTHNFADLAKIAGHPELVDAALRLHERARQAIAAHFWDATNRFWINGYTQQQVPIFTRRSGPIDAIEENIFSPEQNDRLLDQLASSAFRTDWGVRSVATDSAIYDPWSYATGSVSALHSAEVASMFWAEDRPDIAWAVWSAIVPWSTLDSLGHIHEVLTGNYYREQAESVPEQTWSSAGLLDSSVRGLLGIEIYGALNKVIFRPHLPAEWDRVSVANVRLPHSTLALTVLQSIASIDFEIRNSGPSVLLQFQPQIPLGARLTGAEFEGHRVTANVQHAAEDEHAAAEFEVPSGVSHFHLGFSGGVSLILPDHTPEIGNTSTAIKLKEVTLQNRDLLVGVDICSAANNSFLIKTPWQVIAARGAVIKALPGQLYEVRIVKPVQIGTGYAPVTISISFAENSSPPETNRSEVNPEK